MHIHPSSPNSDMDSSLGTEESAAIKIQAGFRGYRVRKQLQCQTRNTSKNCNNHQDRQFRHGSPQCPQQLSGQPSNNYRTFPNITEFSENTNNSGNSFQTRNELENSSGESASVADRCATKIQAGVRGFLVRKKQKLAADAATKIQASFRGFKARKETQRLKQK